MGLVSLRRQLIYKNTTLISNLPCLAAIPSPGKGFRCRPRVQILSRNPERQPAAVYSYVLAIPTTALEATVLTIAFSLDHSSDAEGGCAAYVTVYPPYPLYPDFAHWRGHSKFAMQHRHNTGSSSLPVLSLLFDWRRA